MSDLNEELKTWPAEIWTQLSTRRVCGTWQAAESAGMMKTESRERWMLDFEDGGGNE